MLRASGGSTNGKAAMSPRPSAAIWRMTDARLVRRISGSVNSGRAVEVLLRVQADAGARRHAPAPAGPLGGRRLRDRARSGSRCTLVRRLYREMRAVPGIDHADDAGHGERRLGDVGGQHDPTAGVRREHAVLLGGREAGVQREELHARQVEPGERVGGVADVALAGQEHEQVARTLPDELLHGVDDGLGLVAVVALVLADRPVADLHGVRATGHLDHRRVAEVRGEARGVDGRRGDDHLQVGPLGQQLAEVAEQEVDVEAALVGLVDDQHLVGAQLAVPLDLGEEDPVGHHLDEGVLADAVVEADGEADRVADLGAELLGDPLRDRPRGQPPRLGVTDEAAHTRGRARGTASAAACSCPIRSRPRRPPPGGRGSPRAAPRGARRRGGRGRWAPAAARGAGRCARRRPPRSGHCRLEGFCCTWALTAFVKPRS